MELKHSEASDYRGCHGTFNRTVVELKLNSQLNGGPENSAFNRTVVELKRGAAPVTVQAQVSFNRTVVELKR